MANASGAGRPTNEARQLALVMGDKTYIGAVHARCGTEERYTTGSGCVHCARQATADIREAARLMRHDAEERAAEKEITGFAAVDIPDEARYEQDIDSLM